MFPICKKNLFWNIFVDLFAGGFRVEMQRKSQKDRDILCRYDPVEPGDYIIQVKWSGDHVPGSPFHVRIAGSEDELRVFQQQNQLDYGRYNDDYNWRGKYWQISAN